MVAVLLVVGFVAVELLVVVVGLLVVLDVVVVVVVVGDVVGDVVLELVELELLELWQSRAARSPTVPAPWARFWTRVVLTVDGRFFTWLLNACAALVAAPHCPAATAEETEPSWSFRLLAWLLVSRVLPPPQATRKETAKPRPPARNAREP